MNIVDAVSAAQCAFQRELRRALSTNELHTTAYELSVHVSDEIYVKLARMSGLQSAKWRFTVYCETRTCEDSNDQAFAHGEGATLDEALERASLAIARYLCTPTLRKTQKGRRPMPLLETDESFAPPGQEVEVEEEHDGCG